ncbi:unnamed protein product, partial [marine sediment metagenome]
RGEGLDREGEYSVENLTFKVLRNLGYLDKILKALRGAEDDRMSVTETEESYVCGWCGNATDETGNPTGGRGPSNHTKVNGKCCPGGSRDYQSQQEHEREMNDGLS